MTNSTASESDESTEFVYRPAWFAVCYLASAGVSRCEFVMPYRIVPYPTARRIVGNALLRRWPKSQGRSSTLPVLLQLSDLTVATFFAVERDSIVTHYAVLFFSLASVPRICGVRCFGSPAP
ncbi:hypothetical protein Y032_0141g2230 [Ancylostoma ceylanicum]|uniref:Uncharacterized protein n=1 Tax=Ancylostoma ceylanicum TaxID=53326 RepID=A0A016T3R1_9BILA|nr:hypothetical protein Y032_0141g2230 [Ancylostoma ceylanicum]